MVIGIQVLPDSADSDTKIFGCCSNVVQVIVVVRGNYQVRPFIHAAIIPFAVLAPEMENCAAPAKTRNSANSFRREFFKISRKLKPYISCMGIAKYQTCP